MQTFVLLLNVNVNILQRPVIKVTAFCIFPAMCLSYGFHILITLEPYKVEKVLNTFEK